MSGSTSSRASKFTFLSGRQSRFGLISIACSPASLHRSASCPRERRWAQTNLFVLAFICAWNVFKAASSWPALAEVKMSSNQEEEEDAAAAAAEEEEEQRNEYLWLGASWLATRGSRRICTRSAWLERGHRSSMVAQERMRPARSDSNWIGSLLVRVPESRGRGGSAPPPLVLVITARMQVAR